MMVIMIQRRRLPFLLGIGFLLFVAEGFVGIVMHRIPIAPKWNARDLKMLPRQTRMDLYRPPRQQQEQSSQIASLVLNAVVKEHSKRTTSIGTKTGASAKSSKKIHEMAAFVCARLLQTVMAEIIAKDDDGGGSSTHANLEAVEKLFAALQMNQSDDGVTSDDDEEHISSLSAAAAADITEPTAHAHVTNSTVAEDGTDVAALDPKLDANVEETSEEPPVTTTTERGPLLIPSETTPESNNITSLSVAEKEEKDSITSALVDAGWEDDVDDDEIVSLKKTADVENDLYPKGSVPLPRAEIPSYVVSPLEVVASNLVPLRPSSIPQKPTQTPIASKKDEQTTATAATADVAILIESNGTEEDAGTIFDASRVWDLDEILTSSSGIVAKPTPVNQQQNGDELVRRKLLQKRLEIDATKLAYSALQAEELFRRRLLKRQLELVTSRMADAAATLEEKPDDSFGVEQQKAKEDASTIFDGSRVWDLDEILTSSSGIVAKPTPVKQQQNGDELVRRKLLQKRLEIDATNLAYSALQAEELFRRRLLKRQLELVASMMADAAATHDSFGVEQQNAKEDAGTIFDGSRVWDLDEILTSSSGTVAKSTPVKQTSRMADATATIEEKPDDSFGAERQNAEELVRRKLLQRRLEMVASRMASASLEDKTDSIYFVDESKTKHVDLTARHVADELFRRSLLEKRIVYEEAANVATAKAARNTIQQTNGLTANPSPSKDSDDVSSKDICTTGQSPEQENSEELFRRRLLKSRISNSEIKAGSSQSIKTKELLILENKEKKVNELFQRRLLGKKFEFDTVASETVKKKTDDLFRRRLLKKRLESEAAVIQKELFQRKSSTKKFEYVAKAIQIIQEERDDLRKKNETTAVVSKSIESYSISKNDITDERFEASNAVDEISEMESRKVEVPNNSNLNENLTQENIPNKGDENNESVQAPVRLSDYTRYVQAETKVTRGDEEEDYQTIPRDDWVSSLSTITRQRYSREARMSHSFVPREFNPSMWAINNHFQTIVGTLFRKETMYSNGEGIFLDIVGIRNVSDEARRYLEEFRWDKRSRVETNDGDFFVMDWSYANGHEHDDGNSGSNDDNPLCLICHGLESCSDSEIVREIAIACNEINIDAACLNFRGCHDSGGSCNLTPRGYHLGFTDDLMQQIEDIHVKNPNRRIYLSGFSLGAGVVTKLLAELGPKAYEYNICGAAVNAVPFDCGQNHKALNGPGFTKSVYGDRLLKSMKTRMAKQYNNGGFAFEKSEIDECQTIMDIENLAICPAFGFDDAYDYYDKVKTIDKLHKICVPQYVIQAKDDPFFVGLENVANDEGIPLRIQYTEFGGHCGYILHQRAPNEKNSKTSWMPRQLARFFAHIEEYRGGSDN